MIYEGQVPDRMLVAIRDMTLDAYDRQEDQMVHMIEHNITHRNICDILVSQEFLRFR